MKEEIIKLDGMDKSSRPHTVFRVSNGKVESRAIRDFYDSRLEVGDKVDIYRITKRQFIELMPGDYIVRKEGTHVIG